MTQIPIKLKGNKVKQIGNTKYYITETGDVYSNKYNKIRKLKPLNNGRRHFQVRLYYNKKYKIHYIHRLVYEAFVGEIPENMTIDHIDGNPYNNRLDNLRLATIRKNCGYQNKQRNNNSTGENCIFIHGDKFRVQIQINKKLFRESFCTLEKAIIKRDLIFKNIDPESDKVRRK